MHLTDCLSQQFGEVNVISIFILQQGKLSLRAAPGPR